MWVYGHFWAVCFGSFQHICHFWPFFTIFDQQHFCLSEIFAVCCKLAQLHHFWQKNHSDAPFFVGRAAGLNHTLAHAHLWWLSNVRLPSFPPHLWRQLSGVPLEAIRCNVRGTQRRPRPSYLSKIVLLIFKPACLSACLPACLSVCTSPPRCVREALLPYG